MDEQNMEEDDDSEQPSFKDFDVIKLIGIGGFGKVYLIKEHNTKNLYAMKVLDKVLLKDKVNRALNEYKVLTMAKHPFVTRLYCCFQTELNLYFVMQYCAGGDLFHLMNTQPYHCLLEEDVKYYSSCVLLALEYLHFNGIVYRDLKPENILVDCKGHVMLTDFDMVICSDKIVHKVIRKRYSQKEGLCSEPNIQNREQLGTLEYMSPEIIDGKVYNSSIDWWTFGVLIYELIYGKTPFRGGEEQEVLSLIRRCEIEFPKCNLRGNKLSHKIKHLMKHLIEHNPLERLGAIGGATEIKDHPFFKDIEFGLLNNVIPPIIPDTNVNVDDNGEGIIKDDSKILNPKNLGKGDIWANFKNIRVC